MILSILGTNSLAGQLCREQDSVALRVYDPLTVTESMTDQIPNPIAQTTRRRRRFWILTVVILLLLIVAGACFFHWFNDRTRRFYSYGLYLNAIRDFREEHNRIPVSLRELMTWYNSWEGKYWSLPAAPQDELPEYRLTNDPVRTQVAFVEPKPQSWWQRFDRLIIYVGPDPENSRFEFVWFWQLEDVLAADDAARSAEQ